MRSIAVVDTDPSVRDAVRRAVSEIDVQVVFFSPGAEITAPSGALFDVVLVDGASEAAVSHVAHFLKQSSVPELVLLTELSEPEAMVEVGRLGATDYVLRPSGDAPSTLRNRLLAAMNRALRQRELDQRVFELSAHHERYELAARGANEGLWHWDLRSGELFTSERWRQIVDRADDDRPLSVDDWMSLIVPADKSETRRALEAHVRGETTEFVSEFRIDTGQRSKWVLARGTAVLDDGGRAVRVAGSLADVTLRKEVEAQLAFDAMHDSLTGLPNRTLCMDRLSRAMARAKRNGQKFGVLFLDMDRFKTINDSLGHLAGDELLLEAARRMESCLRETDTVARFGGDEFVVLIDELQGEADATRVAQRLLAKLNRPFELTGHEVYSTASIGIALYHDRYHEAEQMLRDADTAMYRAKAAGKACYRVFDQAMHRRAMELLRLETDLRRAVECNEFCLHYQPIVDLSSGELTGCEALIRWYRRGSTLVMPDAFIPLAEETGLIIPMGRWVLTEACRRIRELSRQCGRALQLSVNISGRQFEQPEFVDEVDAILRQTGVEAESVTLEITESVIMQNPEFSRETFERLKSLRVGLAIDDFGTGYSSLSYLQKFPVDALKVDRSFVRLLEHGGYELEIVKTIVQLARTLGLRVVAEGVESREQQRILTELGYVYGQGYLFAKPMNDSDMFDFAGCAAE